MPKVKFLPSGVTADVRPGTTLLAAALRAGVPVRTRCGGRAGCLMCKVKVLDPAAASRPSPAELRKLGEGSPWRLACQTVPLRDLTVQVPEDPLRAAVRRRLEAGGEEDSLW